MLRAVLTPICVVVGLHCGIILPDIDQWTNLLLHRSIITHSPLIPLILLILASNKGPLWNAFDMGVSIAFSVHHAFDLFPTEWTGYALISIPFYGWTPWLFSWIWIAFSIYACMYIAAQLVREGMDTVWYLLGFIYIFTWDRAKRTYLVRSCRCPHNCFLPRCSGVADRLEGSKPSPSYLGVAAARKSPLL